MPKKFRTAQKKSKHFAQQSILPLRSPPFNPFFRNPIERNRYYFLHEMEKKYHLKVKKPWLWRGTGLHLLELSGFISSDMHRAANYYFQVSNHILKDGPQVAISKIFHRSCHSSSTSIHKNEARIEKKWRDMTKILEQDNVKNILDTLADDRDLPTFEYLVQTELALLRFQQRLQHLQSYLAETSFY
ncbi:MAG: hypothetical protein ACK5PQ_04640 [Alphaproteobacteria bacterium]